MQHNAHDDDDGGVWRQIGGRTRDRTAVARMSVFTCVCVYVLRRRVADMRTFRTQVHTKPAHAHSYISKSWRQSVTIFLSACVLGADRFFFVLHAFIGEIAQGDRGIFREIISLKLQCGHTHTRNQR